MEALGTLPRKALFVDPRAPNKDDWGLQICPSEGQDKDIFMSPDWLGQGPGRIGQQKATICVALLF